MRTSGRPGVSTKCSLKLCSSHSHSKHFIHCINRIKLKLVEGTSMPSTENILRTLRVPSFPLRQLHIAHKHHQSLCAHKWSLNYLSLNSIKISCLKGKITGPGRAFGSHYGQPLCSVEGHIAAEIALCQCKCGGAGKHMAPQRGKGRERRGAAASALPRDFGSFCLTSGCWNSPKEKQRMIRKPLWNRSDSAALWALWSWSTWGRTGGIPGKSGKHRLCITFAEAPATDIFRDMEDFLLPSLPPFFQQVK